MHSAIALRNKQNGFFAVVGRQSPGDVTSWLRTGIRFNTRQDDEGQYLHKGYPFTAYPTGVFFSKSRITEVLSSADTLINQTQACDMVRSNCYTFSATAMVFAVKDLVDRCEDLASIRRVLTVIEQHPLSDHFGIGVTTNPVVTGLLESVLTDVHAYSMLALHPSEESQPLIDQTNRILTRIGTSSKNTCTF